MANSLYLNRLKLFNCKQLSCFSGEFNKLSLQFDFLKVLAVFNNLTLKFSIFFFRLEEDKTAFFLSFIILLNKLIFFVKLCLILPFLDLKAPSQVFPSLPDLNLSLVFVGKLLGLLMKSLIKNSSALVISAYLMRAKEGDTMTQAARQAVKYANEAEVPVVLTMGTKYLIEKEPEFWQKFIKSI